VLRVVHEEFVRWFGDGNAGPVEQYAQIAYEIWELWYSRGNRRPNSALRIDE